MILRGAEGDPRMKGRYHNSFNFEAFTVNEIPGTPDPLSKSQRKRDMDALQNIGAELAELNEQQLAGIELPENLRDAVLVARTMKKNEARRRQMQYIGKLMRQVDPAPIREKLDGWRSVSVEHTARLHHIERWRERMLADPQAVAEFIAEFPATDSQQLRTLIRNTEQERIRGKPPKNFRALFQMIRDVTGNATEKRDGAEDPAA